MHETKPALKLILFKIKLCLFIARFWNRKGLESLKKSDYFNMMFDQRRARFYQTKAVKFLKRTKQWNVKARNYIKKIDGGFYEENGFYL